MVCPVSRKSAALNAAPESTLRATGHAQAEIAKVNKCLHIGYMSVNTETGTPVATEETDMIGNIISSIVIGAVLGALARFILPGKQNISIPTTIIAGMAAAFVGWAIAAIFGFNDTKGFDWWERILQVVLA
ncbi:MAG TPA: hypothetical protein VGJ28_12215, partial [Micromonosporaceae bacterium]